MIAVVLDTNVLVSANLNEEGLEALVVSLSFAGNLLFYISHPILQEYERVLRYPRLNFLPADIDALMRQIRVKGIMTRVSNRRLTDAKHEPDNRFLECAEEGRANYLVTGNKRHFPGRWKTTEVVNAREFLIEFIELTT